MFTQDTIREIAAIAATLNIEAAALLAVADVESGGKAFTIIANKAEPLIRFEGHYFDRRLSGARRLRARAEGLSSPIAGAVANPKTQGGRWDLLGRARAIDAKAANESVSWGIGQVMGAHWAWLGYASVDAMIEEARNDVGGQVRLMARYIDKAGLLPAVRARDWEAFARGYNGPNYRQFGYHLKIPAAYKRYASAAGKAVAAAQPPGQVVRAAQAETGKPAGPSGSVWWNRLSSALGRFVKGRRG